MAKTSTKYMIVAGASVVIVRGGKRVPIVAGGGANFTDEEITAITRGAPGALRTPVNEGRGQEVDEEEEDAEEGVERTTTTTTDTPNKKPKGKAKAKAAAEKPAPAPAPEADDDDEDEDI